MKARVLVCAAAVLAAVSAQSCMIRVSTKDGIFGNEVIKGASKDGELKVSDLGEFDAVRMEGSYDVRFSYGEPEVVIRGAENVLDKVSAEISGSGLVLSTKPGVSIVNGRISVEVRSSSLSSVSLYGSGSFSAADLDEDSMSVAIAGSGDVDLKSVSVRNLTMSVMGSGDIDIKGLDANKVTGSIFGSGDISLAGRAATAEFSIFGSGDVDRGDLDCQKCSISR